MAAVPVSELTDAQRQELLCTYAALILHDDKLEVTPANIQTLVSAANTKVDAYMPMLFSRALGTRDVGTLLSAASTAAPAAGGGGGAAPAAAAAAETKKEEEKVEEEESDDDMGLDLFG